jgi:hypothetical protein
LIKILKTVTPPVVLCGYETWPLTLREEHRKNRMLRGTFGSEREEVTGGIMRSFIICTSRWIKLRI